MDPKTQKRINNLWSEDRDLQNEAFSSILKETEKPVDWAYAVWDPLVEGLRHKDNHVRAISAQILANCAWDALGIPAALQSPLLSIPTVNSPVCLFTSA